VQRTTGCMWLEMGHIAMYITVLLIFGRAKKFIVLKFQDINRFQLFVKSGYILLVCNCMLQRHAVPSNFLKQESA